MNFLPSGAGYSLPSDEPTAGEHLRFELGWPEVRRGLGMILRGCFILIGATMFLGLMIGIVITMSPKEREKIPWQVRDIGFFLGLGAFGLVTLYCYGCVLVGHWRCLLNAPERRGARWLMFACITCLLAGPALGIAASLTGVDQSPQFERGFNGFKAVKYSYEGAIMQLASGVVQVLASLLFILFLRAVAHCFEDKARVFLLDIYLVFTIVLLIMTLGIVVAAGNPLALLGYSLLLALGWLANFAGYIVAVASIRACITAGLERHTIKLDWEEEPISFRS